MRWTPRRLHPEPRRPPGGDERTASGAAHRAKRPPLRPQDRLERLACASTLVTNQLVPVCQKGVEGLFRKLLVAKELHQQADRELSVGIRSLVHRHRDDLEVLGDMRGLSTGEDLEHGQRHLAKVVFAAVAYAPKVHAKVARDGGRRVRIYHQYAFDRGADR